MTKRLPTPGAASEPTTAEATALQVATANLEAAQAQAQDEAVRQFNQELKARELDRLNAIDVSASQSEMPQINLADRRGELVDARARALHQVHYLEGALNEIDYLIALLNPQAPPQPATNAEGDSA